MTPPQPGLNALATRIGTHGSFFAAMKARLASSDFPALAALSTREPSDPAIALLDASATLLDVLSFYSERIANEGYLRTATERRSVLELARLVGYAPRPGVAASVFLSLTLDDGATLQIEPGLKAQSTPTPPAGPGPADLPQTFETARPLRAYAALNRLRPRLSRPQEITGENVASIPELVLAGIGHGVRPGDLLLIVSPERQFSRFPRRAQAVREEFSLEPRLQRTVITLQPEEVTAFVYRDAVLRMMTTARPALMPLIDDSAAKTITNELAEFLGALGQETPLDQLEEDLHAFSGTLNKPATKKLFADNKAGFLQIVAVLGQLRLSDLGDHALLTPALSVLVEIDAVLAAPGLVFSAPKATLDGQITTLKGKLDGVPVLTKFSGTGMLRGTLLKNLKTALDGVSTPTTAALRSKAFNDAVEAFHKETDFALGEVAAALAGAVAHAKAGAIADLIDDIGDKVSPAPGSLRRLQALAGLSPATANLAKLIDEIIAVFLADDWPEFVKDLAKAAKDIGTAPANKLPTGPTLSQIQTQADAAAALINTFAAADQKAEPVKTAAALKKADEEVAVAIVRGVQWGKIYTDAAGVPASLKTDTDDLDKRMRTEVEAEIKALKDAFDPLRPLATGGGTLQDLLDQLDKLPKALDPKKPPIGQLAAALPDLKKLLERAQGDTSTSGETRTLLARWDAAFTQLRVRVVEKASLPVTQEISAGSLGAAGLDELLGKPQPAAVTGSPLDVPRTLQGKLLAEGDDKIDDRLARLAALLSGGDEAAFFEGWRAIVSSAPVPEVYVFRHRGALFGHNAQPKILGITVHRTLDTHNWALNEPDWPEDPNSVRLDSEQPGVVPHSFLALTRPGAARPAIHDVARVTHAPLRAYELSLKTTILGISPPWFAMKDGKPMETFDDTIRKISAEVQSDRVPLGEEPVTRPVGLAAGGSPLPNPLAEGADLIELDGLFRGLEAGRWIVISGERTDLPGVRQSEAALIARVEHSVRFIGPKRPLPGDTPHTRITLSTPLTLTFVRETVEIHGNVVEATHGETRQPEVLGSGDAREEFQRFELKQGPLTFTAAPTAAGAESTLQVRVNDVLWHEVESFEGLGPDARKYLTETGDDSPTRVIFPNGREGARLPTGVENVVAVYRTGIGKAGNVAAGAISQLLTKPLGLKEVTNPLRASGGAERDTRDEMRRHAPLATLALDRLVSVSDFADFARTFAGIGKANAVQLVEAGRRIVHLTVAGASDIPLDPGGMLLANLRRAIARAGDPYLPFRVEPRERVVLLAVAKVRVLPDHLWLKVEAASRAEVCEAFSFESRELGQDAQLSELLAAIQAVPGVDFVDVDLFGGIPESFEEKGVRKPITPAEISRRIGELDAAARRSGRPAAEVPAELAATGPGGSVRPAQLALFARELPDTLVLSEIKNP